MSVFTGLPIYCACLCLRHNIDPTSPSTDSSEIDSDWVFYKIANNLVEE